MIKAARQLRTNERMNKRAVMLVNLGSPDAPEPAAVRRYLNQFLMDPYVIQLPWVLRRLIVSLLVLPRRPRQSAVAYRSIWWQGGSPLVVLSQQIEQTLQLQLNMPVVMAMRYGAPSIESQLLKLAERREIRELLLLPMYPHYADSTVTTTVQEVRRVIDSHQLPFELNIIPPFYAEPDYIDALADSAQPYLEKDYDHLLFSYHGLPESHLRRADPTGSHCLANPNCCAVSSSAHATCYRHQVYATTRFFAQRANIPADRYSISFQSRLGRAQWLEPSTENVLRELGQKGVKRLVVMCPAFVTDCLETLEEIGMRGREIFSAAGGESLELIPCLNEHPRWIDVLAKWCQRDCS